MRRSYHRIGRQDGYELPLLHADVAMQRGYYIGQSDKMQMVVELIWYTANE